MEILRRLFGGGHERPEAQPAAPPGERAEASAPWAGLGERLPPEPPPAPWFGDIRLLDDGRWVIAESHDVLHDGEVDAAALGRLIVPGSEPPTVNRQGIAEILRGAVRNRGLPPDDVQRILEALDRGAVELVVFAGGTERPFAPGVDAVTQLEHRVPGGQVVRIPIRFVADPGG